MRAPRAVRLLAVLGVASFSAPGQQAEVTGLIGGNLNGSLNYYTPVYRRADFGNGLTYGFSAGAALSDVVQVEFQWNRSRTPVFGVPTAGGPAQKVFDTALSQFFGNILFHLADRERQMRPFLLVGFGGVHFSPDAPGTTGLTRPAMALGGGLKYSLSKTAGLRLQLRWLPVNMYTTSTSTWCGPITGCWSMGNDHYLHSLELMSGVSFRF